MVQLSVFVPFAGGGDFVVKVTNMDFFVVYTNPRTPLMEPWS